MLVEVSKENKKFDFDYKAQDLEGLLRRRPERSEEVLEGVFKSCYPDQTKKSPLGGFFCLVMTGSGSAACV